MLTRLLLLFFLMEIFLISPACKKETPPPPPPPPPDTLFTRVNGTAGLYATDIAALPSNDLVVLLQNMTGVFRVTTDTFYPVADLNRQIRSLWVQGDNLYLLEERSGDYFALKANVQTLAVESETPVEAGHHIMVNDSGTIYVIKQNTSVLFGSTATLKRTENGITESFSVPGSNNALIFAGYYVSSYIFNSSGQPVLGTSENSVYTFLAEQDSFAYINGPVQNADIRAFAIDATNRFWFLIGPTIFIRNDFWESNTIEYEGNIHNNQAVALRLMPGRIWTIGEDVVSRWPAFNQPPVIWPEPFALSQTPDLVIKEGLITDQQRLWVSTEDGIFYSDKFK